MIKLNITFIVFCFLSFNTFAIESNSNIAENNFKKAKTTIRSNKINKDDNNIIKAIGDVEIKKGNKILNSKELEYNQNTKIIKANYAVKVYDEEDNNIFFSKKAEMTDDFSKADFYDNIILFENGSTILTPYINRSDESNFSLKKGSYDLCPTDLFDKKLTYEEITEYMNNRKTPLFRLKSSKAKINSEKEELKMYWVSVWFWKIPFFYMPYFKTSSIFGGEANGFGTPGIENTNNYGYGFYIPYKIKGKQQKIRLTPKFYQKGNYQLNTKYNANSLNSNKWHFSFENEITNDKNKSENIVNAYGTSEKEEGVYRNYRGFASLYAQYNFNKLWAFDIDSAVASDRYYFRDYDQNSLSYIESSLRFSRVDNEKTDNYNYFQFSNLFYQELLEENKSYNLPRYAPILDLNLQNTISKNNYNNLFYKLKFNTTSLYRTEGVEYNRISFNPSINDTLNTKIGTINSEFELKNDFYSLNEIGENKTGKYDGSESRVMPQLNLEWRTNFNSQNFTIQPIIKYSGSAKSKGVEKYVPNEDSEPQSISFENIFSNNRFAGYDRQEYGNRITYGFDSSLLNTINLGVAQGYRDGLDDENNLIGFNENVSDIVGYSSLFINNNLDLIYRFLSDKNNFNLKKNEITLDFNTDLLNIYTTYINMDKGFIYDERQQQINNGITLKLFKRWKLNFSNIFDIEDSGRLLENTGSLMYDGGCTKWSLGYRSYNPSTQTEKTTSINFRFSLKFI